MIKIQIKDVLLKKQNQLLKLCVSYFLVLNQTHHKVIKGKIYNMYP